MPKAKAKAKTPVAMDTTPQSNEDEAAAVTADPEGDIDQRMAALLQDHQRMGARPKE